MKFNKLGQKAIRGNLKAMIVRMTETYFGAGSYPSGTNGCIKYWRNAKSPRSQYRTPFCNRDHHPGDLYHVARKMPGPESVSDYIVWIEQAEYDAQDKEN